jgi:hypothetical protein
MVDSGSGDASDEADLFANPVPRLSRSAKKRQTKMA